MFIILGAIGLVVISIAIWFKNEKKQDLLFIIGGLALFAYSLYIKNLIFVILQIVFIISSLTEIIKLNKK